MAVHRAAASALEEVAAAAALDDARARGRRSTVDLPTTCPRCSPTRACCERVLVNLLDNAAPALPGRRAARRRPPAASATPSSCGSSTTAPASRTVQATGLPAVPAARRPDNRHGGVGLGLALVARPHRGDGRHADPRGHPRRRADHDGLAARRASRTPSAVAARVSAARTRQTGRVAEMPPSTCSVVPCTIRASSEARNSTAVGDVVRLHDDARRRGRGHRVQHGPRRLVARRQGGPGRDGVDAYAAGAVLRRPAAGQLLVRGLGGACTSRRTAARCGPSTSRS